MKKLIRIWQGFWAIVAIPFALVTILCSLISCGPWTAKDWAEHIGYWPLRF